jgi:hypothetical protein
LRMSLHGSRVSLIGSLVSFHGSRMIGPGRMGGEPSRPKNDPSWIGGDLPQTALLMLVLVPDLRSGYVYQSGSLIDLKH